MKRLFYMLLSACILVGCSVANRIMVRDNEEEGLKTIRLVQTPEVRVKGAENGMASSSFKDLSILYLLEEETGTRPRVTLETDLPTEIKSRGAGHGVHMILDQENISLSPEQSVRDSLHGKSDSPVKESLKQKYLIPENLWISIVHAKEISYRIRMGEETMVEILLNQKEKEKLSEFMEMAIRKRDSRFPAVPEGQVKW